MFSLFRWVPATRWQLTRNLVMPVVQLLEPENAHKLAVLLASFGLAPRDRQLDSPVLATTVLGLNFRNPIGLAAGFDKHAQAMDGMLAMGFGFVEVRTV